MTAERAEPTVTVVIPCYNLGAYLDEAVQSVLNQTYRDFEIVVIDDGSTDSATKNLFNSYIRPQTRIIRTENRGLAEARNRGLREARGRYISFLDADDVYEPVLLERTVEALEANPSLAFASFWMTAFGEKSFLWRQESCDFPLLLLEDTVCTAALMRRDAVEALGGFDPGMPVAGYEDWDLAIGLVERGCRGMIIPESLFRYRIRPGSMSTSCCSPENHVRLMGYMIQKHPGAYERNIAGALEVLEAKTLELERHRRDGARPSPDVSLAKLDFLERRLASVLESRSWKLSRPVRLLTDFAKSKLRRSVRRQEKPGLSVVITCCDQASELVEAFKSVSLQATTGDEIVIVDHGSANPVTRHLLDGFRSSGARVLRAGACNAAAARDIGIRGSRAPLVFAMGADQTIETSFLTQARNALRDQPGLQFVSGGFRDREGSGFTWTPHSFDVVGILSCRRFAFPVIRREALRSIGGYDAKLASGEQADWDLMIRLAEGGIAGAVWPEAQVNFHLDRRPRLPGQSAEASLPAVLHPLYEKHRALFEKNARGVAWGQDTQRRRLQAVCWDPFTTPDAAPTNSLDWGGLRRLEPVSRVWGMDRGQIIDRYYIEKFLEKHRSDIRGRAFEIKEHLYVERFGSNFEKIDIVDVAPQNPAATVIADLRKVDSLPESNYDCAVITQTIHVIDDLEAVLQSLERTLKPGGVLLATLPCVSRIDYESGVEGDFWRFTPASAKWSFEKAFGEGNVEVEAFGNVLTSCGFLLGLSADELTREEMEHRDPYFPLLLGVRAVKRGKNQAPIEVRKSRGASAEPRGAILLYHRIAKDVPDRWKLCVSPENFAKQLDCVRRDFHPMPLSAMIDALRTRSLPDRAIAVTFDDGYRDNFTEALPRLKQSEIPATFFISGGGAVSSGGFWWERLDRAMDKAGMERDEARRLHARMMEAAVEERERAFSELPDVHDSLPPLLRSEDLLNLSREPLVEIGAHGWSHRALGSASRQVQESEIFSNVEELRRLTASAVTEFSYPFGGPFTDDTIDLLRRAGITSACTVQPQTVNRDSNLFALPRLETGDWEADEFRDRLNSVFS